MKPSNYHGVNPAIAHLNGKQRKAILKDEARRRASGDWGNWQTVSKDELRRMLINRIGWILDTREAYRNRIFCVLERLDATGVIHAAVQSLSGIRPTWYEMQRIKDELFGPESTAVEIYPPHREIVDGSDMFHLWILPDDIPFGLTKIDASRQAASAAGDLLAIKENLS